MYVNPKNPGTLDDIEMLNEYHREDIAERERVERDEERNALERAARRPHRVIHELPRKCDANGYHVVL